MKLKISNKG